MNTFEKTFGRLAAGFVLSVSTLLFAPPPAAADYQTFQRSIANILFAPLDLVLSPATAAKTQYENMTTIEDSTAVRYGYALPGYLWLTGVQVGAAMLRGVSGGLELLPGIALLPFPDTTIRQLFDPAERADGLVDYQNPVLPMKFGLDYVTQPE